VFGHYAWPEGVRPDEQRRLREILHQQALTERFPHTPCPTLDGKTPTEAAQDSKYKVPLLAMLLNIELAADHDIDMNSLRRQLNLPEREPLDPATCDCERLPVHRLSQIDVSKLSDDQLLVVYRRAYSVMAVVPLRKIALELIGRPSLDDRIDKVEAYDILSDVADNSDEALEYLDKARKLATAEGESPAAWLIDELEIRLVRGEFDKFGQLIKEIQARYMKEPGIPQALIQVLARYGLVTPDGRVVVPVTRGEEPAEAAVAAGVWTPESGSGAEGPKSEPKIWLPGMD
jgi:hypothetical protein